MKKLVCIWLALSLYIVANCQSNSECAIIKKAFNKLSGNVVVLQKNNDVAKNSVHENPNGRESIILSQKDCDYLLKLIIEKVGELTPGITPREDEIKKDTILICAEKYEVTNIGLCYAIKSKDLMIYSHGCELNNAEISFNACNTMAGWAMKDQGIKAIKDSLAGDYSLQNLQKVKSKFIAKKGDDASFTNRFYQMCIEEMNTMIEKSYPKEK